MQGATYQTSEYKWDLFTLILRPLYLSGKSIDRRACGLATRQETIDADAVTEPGSNTETCIARRRHLYRTAHVNMDLRFFCAERVNQICDTTAGVRRTRLLLALQR